MILSIFREKKQITLAISIVSLYQDSNTMGLMHSVKISLNQYYDLLAMLKYLKPELLITRRLFEGMIITEISQKGMINLFLDIKKLIQKD
jgi:hypothetical protein